MTKPFILLLGLTALAGCMADREPVVDPSPQATLSDNVTEPTDGLDNEVGVNQ